MIPGFAADMLRRQIADRLLTSTSLRAIAREIGAHHSTVRKYAGPLIDAMRESCALPDCRCGKPRFHLGGCVNEPRALGRRAKRKAPARPLGPPIHPSRDPLYRRVRDALPGWLHPELRDDVISEMVLSILEGAAPEADILAQAKRFANAATAEYRSKWAPISLDSPMFEDSTETLADCIADPAALEAFDRIMEARP